MGNAALANQLLDQFAAQLGGAVDEIACQLEADNAAALAHLAHRLKGTAASMSADLVRQAAWRLEDLGREGRLQEAGPGLEELKREIDRCLAFLPEARLRVTEASSCQNQPGEPPPPLDLRK